MNVEPAHGVRFDCHVPILIVGAGACGLTAALSARDAGAEVWVLERDATPSGSTALSSGMIPACGTRLQTKAGILDDAALMAADIQRKCGSRADPEMVATVCRESARTLEWLMDSHAVELTLVEGFLYPGHSVPRMHAPATRQGATLMAALLDAADKAQVDVVTNARVTSVYGEDDGTVAGVGITRPNGRHERLGCGSLILACNGYGGNPDLVGHYIPEMADALYFGHPSNQGDALVCGMGLGGEGRHLGAYQGHGSVATPHGILITWALMMEGGIQVNAQGERFSSEHQGYSEQAIAVLTQPGGVAWDIFDERLYELAMAFDDFRTAVELSAVKRGDNSGALARVLGLPADALARSIDATSRTDIDYFGRDFATTEPLRPPYFGVKVTGALFHTQGGLRIDSRARVLRAGRSDPLPNLLAGGGAACGVSGPDVAGYLSGNGLLTATVLGRTAGLTAARR